MDGVRGALGICVQAEVFRFLTDGAHGIHDRVGDGGEHVGIRAAYHQVSAVAFLAQKWIAANVDAWVVALYLR